MKVKHLKSRMLLTVGVVLTSSLLMLAQAQTNERPLEDVAKQRGKELKDILGLGEEQSSKASDIFLSFYKKMRAIREVNMSQEDRKEAVGRYSKERDSSLRTLMSQEQWSQLLELRKKEVAQRQQQKKQQ